MFEQCHQYDSNPSALAVKKQLLSIIKHQFLHYREYVPHYKS